MKTLSSVRRKRLSVVGQPDWLLDQVGRPPAGILITVLFLGTAVPIVEELVFGRGLYSVLALIRPLVALIGSAVAFAALHPKEPKA